MALRPSRRRVMLGPMPAAKKKPARKKAPTPVARRKSVSTRRRQQLIEAKGRQRERDKAAGHAFYRVKLPAPAIEKLKRGMNDPEFVSQLTHLLDQYYPD